MAETAVQPYPKTPKKSIDLSILGVCLLVRTPYMYTDVYTYKYVHIYAPYLPEKFNC